MQSCFSLEPTTAKLKDLIVDHLNAKLNLAAIESYRHYGAFWTKHLGERRVNTIQPVDIEQALQTLKNVKQTTVYQYFQFLRHLMFKRVQPRSAVIDLWSRLEQPRIEENPYPPFKDDGQARLYAVMDDDYDRLYVRLAILLGRRRKIFFSLRWEYLDWGKQRLYIPGSKRRPPEQLPVPGEAMQILLWFWDQHGQPLAGWIFPRTKVPVFSYGPGWKLKRTGPRIIYYDEHVSARRWYETHFKPAVIKAGLDLEKIVFHSTRKTWATNIGESTSATVLQGLGNWSDPRMVTLYCTPSEDARRAAMERGARVTPMDLLKALENTPKPVIKSANKSGPATDPDGPKMGQILEIVGLKEKKNQ
jgi:integrase